MTWAYLINHKQFILYISTFSLEERYFDQIHYDFIILYNPMDVPLY